MEMENSCIGGNYSPTLENWYIPADSSGGLVECLCFLRTGGGGGFWSFPGDEACEGKKLSCFFSFSTVHFHRSWPIWRGASIG